MLNPFGSQSLQKFYLLIIMCFYDHSNIVECFISIVSIVVECFISIVSIVGECYTFVKNHNHLSKNIVLQVLDGWLG